MNYQLIEEHIKAGYREITPQYRRDDEVEVQTENHHRLAEKIQKICWSFDHPIKVLDVGCGTGRYFHCLKNITELTGIDISEDMLAAAANPVCRADITIPQIKLERGNVYLKSFPPRSFNFIYSLGMFGHGCPVSADVCNKFHEWLKPGGKLLFDVVDVAGLPIAYRLRRSARSLLYPLIGKRLQRRLDEREQLSPFFGLTRRQLEKVMRGTSFNDFIVTSHICRSPLWTGRHLECSATRHHT